MNREPDGSNRIADSLAQAVETTFAEMAFIDAIPSDEPGGNPKAQVFAIDVTGEAPLRLVLDLPLAVKRTIVENVHACAWDELSSADIDDCLLEFLNVLGGAFGRELWGEERYKLTFPEVLTEVPPPQIEPDQTTFWFDAYGSLFAVHVIGNGRG